MLKKVTGLIFSIFHAAGHVSRSTSFWDIHPDIILVECILVCVKASKPASAFPDHVLSSAIHGCILLMAEDNPIAGPTLPGSPSTLTTYGPLFVAFELPLAAGLTEVRVKC
jgi:hypothetical protein